MNGIVSQNLTLADGFEDEGADRYNDNLIAFWDFKEGTGSVALDTSGVAPAIDLTLEGPTLMSSYGIRVETGRAIGTALPSKKLYDLLAEPAAARSSTRSRRGSRTRTSRRKAPRASSTTRRTPARGTSGSGR